MTDVAPLTMLGSGETCGEFCEIPEHHEQAIVNRRVDEDNV